MSPSFDVRSPRGISKIPGAVRWISRLACSALLAPAAQAARWRAEGPPLGTVHPIAVDPANPAVVLRHDLERWPAGVTDHRRRGRWNCTVPLSDRSLLAANMLGSRFNREPFRPGEKNPVHPALWRSKDRGTTWEARPFQVTAGSIVNTAPGPATGSPPPRPAAALGRGNTPGCLRPNLTTAAGDGPGKPEAQFRVPGQDAYAMARPSEERGTSSAPLLFPLFRRSQGRRQEWKADGNGPRPGDPFAGRRRRRSRSTPSAAGSRSGRARIAATTGCSIASPVSGAGEI